MGTPRGTGHGPCDPLGSEPPRTVTHGAQHPLPPGSASYYTASTRTAWAAGAVHPREISMGGGNGCGGGWLTPPVAPSPHGDAMVWVLAAGTWPSPAGEVQSPLSPSPHPRWGWEVTPPHTHPAWRNCPTPAAPPVLDAHGGRGDPITPQVTRDGAAAPAPSTLGGPGCAAPPCPTAGPRPLSCVRCSQERLLLTRALSRARSSSCHLTYKVRQIKAALKW